MIEKYCLKFKLDPKIFPKSDFRSAMRDLLHWIKVMYTDYGREMPLVNWREAIELRVQHNKSLQKKLVTKLFSTDVDEAKYWAKKYNLKSEIKTLQKKKTGKKFIREENVVFVNNCEKYTQFIFELSTCDEKVIGLDSEFLCSRKVDKVCLVQISSERKV